MFEAQFLVYVGRKPGEYVFERPDWWIKQIGALAEFYLRAQFGDDEQVRVADEHLPEIARTVRVGIAQVPDEVRIRVALQLAPEDSAVRGSDAEGVAPLIEIGDVAGDRVRKGEVHHS